MLTAGYVLLAERRSRTLARMLTTTLTRAEVIAGHTLAMFLVSFVQTLLLTIFGQLVFGVDYWHAPGATLLMVGALALFSASFGLLISALARNENQVVLLALGSTLVLALMGGAFFPLDLTGRSFAAAGHLLPSAWAIDGLQSISLRGLGLEAVLLPAGILLAYTVAVFWLAVWRFKFETG
jgi:ABC-2 type transport system permease protein